MVDDEQSLLDLFSEYLSDCGYTVHIASNGAEALEIFRMRCGEIDLVITDLGMPGISGDELYSQLRLINPSIKVIISSGYLDAATKNSLLNAGIITVFTKPYRFSVIGEEIIKALGA